MNLITLEEYKSYRDIEHNNPKKDTLHSILISSVSKLIKEHCNKTFIDHYTTPKTEIVTTQPGMDAIVLSEIPLRLVSGATLGSLDITSDILVDTEKGILHYGEGFIPGFAILEVTYTGGYAETPADVKLAAFELVDYYADAEHKAKKTFGGGTVEYHQLKESWPFHIKALLDMYRDV